jgi:RHS repeat-associated protein
VRLSRQNNACGSTALVVGSGAEQTHCDVRADEEGVGIMRARLLHFTSSHRYQRRGWRIGVLAAKISVLSHTTSSRYCKGRSRQLSTIAIVMALVAALGIAALAPTSASASSREVPAGLRNLSPRGHHLTRRTTNQPAAAWGTTYSPDEGSANNQLLDVSCATSMCMAVGSWVDSNNQNQTLTEQETGAGWTITPSGNGPTDENNVLYGVDCVSRDYCVAVGLTEEEGVGTQTLVETWNGRVWSITASPDQGTDLNNTLSGVSCVSASDCVAVGYYETTSDPSLLSCTTSQGTCDTLIETWNGSSWSITTSPNQGSYDTNLLSVSCGASTSCVAVGQYFDGTIIHPFAATWSGSGWSNASAANAQSDNALLGVSCTSSTFCMSVGYYGNNSTGSWILTEIWNGSTWTVEPGYNEGGNDGNGNTAYLDDLNNVSCTSATSCTAGGLWFPTNGCTTDCTANNNQETLIESWDGTSWSIMTSPNESSGANISGAVSCTTSTSCVAVGYYVNGSGMNQTLVLTYPTDTTLVSYWPAQGNANDVVSGNNGTLEGSTTYGPGVNGQAFAFQDEGDGVLIGNPSDLQLQTFTIGAWIKRASTSAVTYSSSPAWHDACIFCFGYGGYGFGISADSNLFLSQIGIGGIDSSFYITDTAWHFVTVSVSGSSVVFSVDGASATAGQYSPGYYFDTSAAIGLRADVSENTFAGSIAGVEVWNTALTPSQLPPAAVLSAQNFYGGGSLCASCLANAIHAVVAAPVDTEDGNMYDSYTDLDIPGRGFPLSFTRSYNSMAAVSDTSSGPLGYGWADNLGANLSVSEDSPPAIGDTAVLTEENGAQTTFTYNGAAWQPPPEVIATLTQNSNGSWTLVRDATQTLDFNSAGQLTAMTDLNGHMTKYKYNSSGELTTVTDSAGRRLVLAYSGSHINSVTDPNVTPHRVVHFKYDSAGDLVQVTDVNGGVTKYTYNSAHQMTSTKSPDCVTTPGCLGIRNVYDTQGRVISQTDQMNRKTTFVYSGDPSSATGGSTLVTDPVGHETLYSYQYGLLVSETKGYGSAGAATTSYTYDPATLEPTQIVDPNGNATTMTYDSSGNLLTRTDALGRETVWTYNSFNEPLTMTDPKQVETTYSYDSHGNLTEVQTYCADCATPANQTTSYTVCETKTCRVDGNSYQEGDVESTTDPDDNAWIYTYDKYGDRTSTTDPLGNESTATYNADGWLVSSVSPNGNAPGANPLLYTTTYKYNPFGQLTSTEDPLGDIRTYGYDQDRNLTSVKDADENLTTYVYDLDEEQTKVIGPTSPSTTLVTNYNKDGTVHDHVNGAGIAIETYGYDSLGRVTSVKDALKKVTSYTYDGDGNILTVTNPNKQVTTMTYDHDDELQTVSYSNDAADDVTNITYDYDGQRTQMTDGTGTSSWTYDGLHQLTSYENGNGAEVQYTYNLDNLPVTITYPGDQVVTDGYNDADELTSVEDWNSNTSTFGYDHDGNLTSDNLANGVTDSYSYDDADQMTSVSDLNSGGTTIFAASYTRDADGLLTSDSSQATNQDSYQYTALNQLCYAASSDTAACSSPPSDSYPYGYDAADNLTTLENSTGSGIDTQQFNAADELCWTVSGPSSAACSAPPSGATLYSYDPEGNRAAATPSTGPATCYSYDQANELTGIETGTGSSCTNPTNVATYGYDGDGTRESKTEAGTTTEFLWSGSGSTQALLDEQAGTTNPTYFVYGPGGLPLEEITPSSAVYFYAHDQLGSTRALTNSSGASVASYNYDPYGNLLASSSPGTVGNPLLFAGQYLDAESGLYYLRARYYDPTTGQFLTVDPAEAETTSPYAYVDGDPLNAVDKTGLQGTCELSVYACPPPPPPPPCNDPGPLGACSSSGNAGTASTSSETPTSELQSPESPCINASNSVGGVKGGIMIGVTIWGLLGPGGITQQGIGPLYTPTPQGPVDGLGGDGGGITDPGPQPPEPQPPEPPADIEPPSEDSGNASTSIFSGSLLGNTLGSTDILEQDNFIWF